MAKLTSTRIISISSGFITGGSRHAEKDCFPGILVSVLFLFNDISYKFVPAFGQRD